MRPDVIVVHYAEFVEHRERLRLAAELRQSSKRDSVDGAAPTPAAGETTACRPLLGLVTPAVDQPK